MSVSEADLGCQFSNLRALAELNSCLRPTKGTKKRLALLAINRCPEAAIVGMAKARSSLQSSQGQWWAKAAQIERGISILSRGICLSAVIRD